MEKEFNNKVVLVTGAGRGIGRSLSEYFAQNGADLVLYGRSNNVETAADELKKGYNVKALPVIGNVNSEDDVKNLFEKIKSEYGKLDVCVNNAGISINALTMRMNKDDWDKILDINLTGVFLIAKAAVTMMIREKYGRIINMSSIVGLKGNIGQVGYAATKAGIIGVTKSIALEVAKRGITCNAVAPGFINTEMTKELDDKVKDHYMSRIPMNKYGEPEDVSELVGFLASDRSKYITGQVIVVDGGMTIS